MKTSRIFSFFAAGGLLLAMAACGGGSSSTTPTPPQSTLVVNPSSANVTIGAAQPFTVAGVTGTVTWSITPSVGTISPTGIYTAPSTFPSPTSKVLITANAGSLSGTATAQVVYPNNNSTAQAGAVKLGTSGGNVLDESTTACCIGTLGSLITRASAQFILSNNHVLGKSDAGTIGIGDLIDQPGPIQCFSTANNVGTTVARAALKPTSNSTTGTCANSGAPLCGPAPSNVDAAIAQVNPGDSRCRREHSRSGHARSHQHRRCCAIQHACYRSGCRNACGQERQDHGADLLYGAGNERDGDREI